LKKAVDLYDSHYGKIETEVYRAVRVEAFGEDLGQTSWITAPECDEFCRWLGLRAGQKILEVACGSGGTSLRIAESFGVAVTGIDINQSAIGAAKNRAKPRAADNHVKFQVADANEALPFPDESFDVVFCNDSVNHMQDREQVLAEWYRVLRPGGRCLYTDPAVVTGWLSKAEMEARSSIGSFLFTSKGLNEACICAAGFRLVLTADVTASVARTSQRWHTARSKRRKALCEEEGETTFEELQNFLRIVHMLASEGRLSRFAFIGEKTARAEKEGLRSRK
jgi:SAM-dependent methyltransferase